jgi:predicted RNA binding protein YcfA (HicA-like mRNA interferase family)
MAERKLMQLTAIIEREDDGYEVRRKGSHIIMQKRIVETTITVVVPDHKPVRRGTLKSIISQSKLPSTLFEHVS